MRLGENSAKNFERSNRKRLQGQEEAGCAVLAEALVWPDCGMHMKIFSIQKLKSRLYLDGH